MCLCQFLRLIASVSQYMTQRSDTFELSLFRDFGGLSQGLSGPNG
jgi:hypothetical protein